MINDLKPLLKKFLVYAKTSLNFKKPPRLFLKKDKKNSECLLGKTAHYDPAENAITVYISGRHPKDIIRSMSHELVHHCQNERGDLAPEKMKTMNQNYAQENDHMRKMEKEAYLLGNMCFRDWEDGLDDKLQYRMHIAEQKFLKENKNMSVKVSKKFLKSLITKLLEQKLEEHGEEGGCGTCPVDCTCPECEKKKDESEEEPIEEGELPPGLKAYQDKKRKDSGAASDDDDDDDLPAGVDSDGKTPSPGDDDDDDDDTANESKIQTPEHENKLYESRFSNRNRKLFKKLVKQWVK